MTNSRGGLISLGAEILFLACGWARPRALVTAGACRAQNAPRAAMVRAGLAFRADRGPDWRRSRVRRVRGLHALAGNSDCCRSNYGPGHFWSWRSNDQGISNHRIRLGSFWVIYTRYDSTTDYFVWSRSTTIIYRRFRTAALSARRWGCGSS